MIKKSNKIMYSMILYILLLIFTPVLYAVEPIIVKDQQKSKLVGMNMEILQDDTGELTIEDILSKGYDKKFKPAGNPAPNFGFTNDAYWGRFKVRFYNKSRAPFLLQFNFANLNYVDIYQISDKGEVIKTVKTGNMRPVRSRDQLDPKIVFVLMGNYGKEYMIYFRVKNDASMTLSMSLSSISEYMRVNNIQDILIGLFIGIMLLIVAYNIFLSFSLKDLSYIYFSIAVLSLAAYVITIKGYAYIYLWPDKYLWNRASIPLFVSSTGIFFLLYITEFLQLKKQLPGFNKIFKISLVLLVIALFGAVFGNYISFILIINALVSLTLSALLIVGIILWIRKIYRSLYFHSGLLLLSIGVFMTILVRVGLLPSAFITENAFVFTTLLFVIFMSLALADRVSFYKSQQESAKSEMQDYEERLRALVETSNDIIWEIDAKRRFTYINPRVKDILGFEPQEVIGKDVFAVIIPLYPDIIKKAMLESINTGNPVVALEYGVMDKQGRTVIFEKNAMPVFDKKGNYRGFKGIDRDITQRKKYERALQESEERFRIIVENAPVGIVIGATPFTFKYVNPKFIEMTGYSEEELLGGDISMLLDENTMSMVVERYKRRLNGEDVPSYYEIEYKRKDGEIRIAEMRVSVGKNPDGTSMVINQILDVTDTKHLQQQLIQSQKMEAIGTLAGGIAHDFNNLLTVIKGYSEICLMQTAEDDENFKQIQAIRIAGEKAESLTKQMLAFSKKQEHKPKIVEINSLLKELHPLTERLVGKGIKIELNLKENLPEIIADPSQIEQIIINMMVNARDALNNLENHNRVKLITIETGETVSHNFTEDNTDKKYVLITISDTGVGMSQEVQDKIFDPFYTTKEAGKGTGLGLATVYGILKQNGGAIDVFSEIGKGTIFKIYWPAAGDELNV